MTRSPIVFRTKQRVAFSDLDPYHHVTTAAYSRYYINHRMHGLRDTLGWDMKAIEELPFMVWVKRMEVDFLKPALPDQELTITSFVREFRGPDAFVECRIVDEAEREISRCLMVVACVDRRTSRSMDWPADAMALFLEGS
jgi:acyl-CoA thioester hydrolase